jgi:hypothetical protein
MRRVALLLTASLLALSSLACSISLPGVELPTLVPRLEVGEMQEYVEEVPRDGVEEARVEVTMGTGEITLAPGEADPLFSGHFRTNVAAWAPEVTWEDGLLRIAQSETRGMPEAGARNEWELTFSPEVPMEMSITVGAGQGELDFSGLALTRLTLESGASDLVARFDAPNPARMERLTVRAGAANLEVSGIGNAGPREMRVEGGVGNLVLDLTGDWPSSAEVQVTAGTGALTLRVPADVGVRVEMTGGLGGLEVDDAFTLSDGAYVNPAFGTAQVELLINVTLGVGSVTLEQVE